MLTVVLTADSDAELNDVCSFIKIDTSQTEKAESEYSSEKATEEVVVEKVKTQEVSEFLANPYSYCMPAARKLLEVDFADNYSDTYIFTLGLFKGKSNSQIDSFLGKPLEDGTKETEGKFGIRAVFGFNIDVEVYADYHIFTDSFYDIELRSNFTLELDLAAIENVNVGLGVIYIPLISSLAHLTVEPKFNIWGFGGLKLKREFSNSLTIDSINGINGTPMEMNDSTLSLSGNVEISFQLEMGLNVINSKFLKGTITPEIGIGLSVDKELANLDGYHYSNSDYEKHLCEKCSEGTLYLYGRINASIDILDHFDYSILLHDKVFKETPFYISTINGKVEFGFSNCPHKEYKVKVKDQKGRLLNGAKIFDCSMTSNNAESAYNGKSTTIGKPIARSLNGKASFYLPLSDISNRFFSLNAVYKDGEDSYVIGSSKIKYDNSEEITKPFDVTITLYLESTKKETEDEEKEKDENKDTEEDNSINVIHGEL